MTPTQQAQVKVLETLKPLLRPNQQKLIDIAILLAKGEDKWVINPEEADRLLEKIKALTTV